MLDIAMFRHTQVKLLVTNSNSNDRYTNKFPLPSESLKNKVIYCYEIELKCGNLILKLLASSATIVH